LRKCRPWHRPGNRSRSQSGKETTPRKRIQATRSLLKNGTDAAASGIVDKMLVLSAQSNHVCSEYLPRMPAAD
jgi:hypothetical protein